MSRLKITAITTKAIDTIIYKDTGEVEKKLGGPAFWIQKALSIYGVELEMVLGDCETDVEVEIVGSEPLPGRNDTHGSRIILGSEIFSDAVLINVMDSFDLEQIIKIPSIPVFLDIGGYTRSGPWQQEKSTVNAPSKEARSKILIVKANHEELPYVPDDWLEEQKSERILLHTLGKDGVEMWVKGERFNFSSPVVTPKNVLGAGDTFGACFLYYYLLNEHNPVPATKLAISEVAKFLTEK